MSRRLCTALCALGAVAIPLIALLTLRADGPGQSVGKTIASFTLKDTTGRPVALADFKDRKAVVVIFLGTQCPINNQFAPHLAGLHKEFSPKGVQFLGLNSNHQDSSKTIAEHAKKYAIPFPVLRDEGSKVADNFGARRTPEAFILDTTGKVRYQGRIDDQYGISYQRPAPTRRDLAIALDELLAGKQISQATTPIAGCLIGRAPRPKAEATVTYARHVAPILQNRCQECHRPGQIGPFSLLTYDDSSSWSAMIHEVVEERRMPPWHADPKHGKWSNDRSLSPEERKTILAWIDQGCPKGDMKDLPKPREFVKGWTIGKPDAVFEMKEEYAVPARGPKTGIPYEYFEVETGFTEDKWVERAESRPGATEVVHHIIVFIVPPGQPFNKKSPNFPTLSGTAPGDMPLILPPGMAKRVPAGARLVFQMHYTPNGKAQKDRSRVGLIFAKKPPEKEVITRPVFNFLFRIPPGDAHHEVQSSWTFPRDGHIVGFMPHMHLRGKDFLYRAHYPDGKMETLLSVPRFDFGWQSVYRPATPIAMPKGTRLECIAHFDNSKGNRNNPDPTRPVVWGDQTWEEMMIGWTDIAFERKKQ
ncbi:MAG: redoxin domain-containing protein [Gemmataceae bacterium]|nr:redoxin domain-containing protein [Gemmataceae bacterium]